MPDQLAREGEDPWEVAPGASDEEKSAADLTDTDEAGTGRQDGPRSATVHQEDPIEEHPAPDEPTA
ncbi:hypothetical protein [Streptomyces sp. H51]|uniref:hypothetical protein n=1 Tax=Streptomyces sp. H51 TaxID=3111770 RepID=UPI002D796F0E|nr:hypothetical protein [Streptomyces sp. H51]